MVMGKIKQGTFSGGEKIGKDRIKNIITNNNFVNLSRGNGLIYKDCSVRLYNVIDEGFNGGTSKNLMELREILRPRDLAAGVIYKLYFLEALYDSCSSYVLRRRSGLDFLDDFFERGFFFFLASISNL